MVATLIDALELLRALPGWVTVVSVVSLVVLLVCVSSADRRPFESAVLPGSRRRIDQGIEVGSEQGEPESFHGPYLP